MPPPGAKTVLKQGEKLIGSLLGKGGSEAVETELQQLAKMSDKQLLDLGGEALTKAERDFLRSSTNATSGELGTATRGFKHEVTDTELALKLAREQNAASRIKAVGTSAGQFVRYAAPGAALGYAGYQLGRVPGRILGDLESIPGAVANTIRGGAGNLSEEARHTLDGVEDKIESIAEGMGSNLPNKSDITDAFNSARNAAHDVTAAIPVAETAITIGAVLLGAVVLYEVYRYVR